MTVHVLGTDGCRTMGDALRDLDARALIRSHFILLAGDTITNAKLLTVLEKHKRNCKYDKGLAMTVVFKRSCTKIRSGDEVVIAKDPLTGRLFHNQRLNPLVNEKKLSFPLELFTEQSSLVLEHDLVDPQIAICSPAALPLFSDNFDFLTRDDFLTGVLINEEMLDSRIYCEELPADEYAARCSNWQSYKRVSHDIISRWAYPLVPDMGICGLRQHYVFYRNNIYRSAQTALARSSQLKENVVIGASEVAEGTAISYSAVGRGCRIGKDCRLRNVFVMDGARIGDNCQLSNCVIGWGAVLGDNCRISECGVIGEGVELSAKTVVQKNYVQATRPEDDYEEFEAIGERAFVVKQGASGMEAEGVDSDEEEDEEATQKVPVLMNRMASLDNVYESSNYSSDSEDDEEEGEGGGKGNFAPDDGQIFLGEVIESIKRGYEKKNNPDFLILEINSSRYAYNMSLNEVNFYVVKAIFHMPSLAAAAEEEASFLKEFKQVYTYMSSVLKNYIRGAEAMTDCLKAIYDCCVTGHEMVRRKISQILCLFYNEDILADTAILKWYDGLMTEDEEKVDWVQRELAKFIEWLQEEEEEESSDDEEDSD